ncbi:MAG: energy transducer TonB [Deltaproteobacteria bacterium]|nr:MAG: energy transducer TonB [Deltaproteobacteria bacterium]
MSEAEVVLRLTINPRGLVEAASILEGVPSPTVVSSCLTDRARRWSFASPPEGQAMAAVPIRFTAIAD